MSNDLSKRAIGLKGWRWMPGMRAVGRRNLPAAWFRVEEVVPSLTGEWADAVPDLTDPATLGCLLAQVRGAWAPARVVVYHQHGQPSWEINVELPDGSMPCVESAASEGTVLVAALEAAERREVSDE